MILSRPIISNPPKTKMKKRVPEKQNILYAKGSISQRKGKTNGGISKH